MIVLLGFNDYDGPQLVGLYHTIEEAVRAIQTTHPDCILTTDTTIPTHTEITVYSESYSHSIANYELFTITPNHVVERRG